MYKWIMSHNKQVTSIGIQIWSSNRVLENPEFDLSTRARKASLKHEFVAPRSFAEIAWWLERPNLHSSISCVAWLLARASIVSFERKLQATRTFVDQRGLLERRALFQKFWQSALCFVFCHFLNTLRHALSIVKDLKG